MLSSRLQARRGDVYLGSKCLEELQDYHFGVAGHVANSDLETSLQRSFRDLRVILSEVADEGRDVTPAVLNEIASFGERMSSEALESGGVPSVHLDARQVILTDRRHTQATPLYFESYAKLRRMIPYLSDGRVVVLGGFIGFTEDGVTTTLGRGGSDLTASIVGAGISADEIQILDGCGWGVDVRSARPSGRLPPAFAFLSRGFCTDRIRCEGPAS